MDAPGSSFQLVLYSVLFNAHESACHAFIVDVCAPLSVVREGWMLMQKVSKPMLRSAFRMGREVFTFPKKVMLSPASRAPPLVGVQARASLF